MYPSKLTLPLKVTYADKDTDESTVMFSTVLKTCSMLRISKFHLKKKK